MSTAHQQPEALNASGESAAIGLLADACRGYGTETHVQVVVKSTSHGEDANEGPTEPTGPCAAALACPRRLFATLLPAGGVGASALNLASATLGAGTLAVPKAFAAAGPLLGSILLLVCCAATVYSIRLLTFAYELVGCHTYEQAARQLVGPKFEKITAFLVVAFCWGITIVYVVAMGDILGSLSSSMPTVFHGVWGTRLATSIFWLCCMLPLSLAKEINSLRYASLVGMTATAVLVTAVVVHAATMGPSAAGVTHIAGPNGSASVVGTPVPTAPAGWTTFDNLKPLAALDIKMLVALPTFIFSFSCQTNAFEIYTELAGRTINKMTGVTALSLFSCTTLYIVVGFAGLADFGQAIHGNILVNYGNPAPGHGNPTYIFAAVLSIAFTLTMAFPICIFPTRDAVLQVLGYKDAYSTPSRVRVPVCAALATASLIAGLFIPGIDVLFGVLGGICGSLLGFVWPVLFLWRSGRLTPAELGWGNVIASWTLLAAGIIFGTMGTIESLYDAITG